MRQFIVWTLAIALVAAAIVGALRLLMLFVQS